MSMSNSSNRKLMFVLAVSFPASGLESTYRDSLVNIVSMLYQKHANKYMVFNVSERRYDISKLNNQVCLVVDVCPLFIARKIFSFTFGCIVIHLLQNFFLKRLLISLLA